MRTPPPPQKVQASTKILLAPPTRSWKQAGTALQGLQERACPMFVTYLHRRQTASCRAMDFKRRDMQATASAWFSLAKVHYVPAARKKGSITDVPQTNSHVQAWQTRATPGLSAALEAAPGTNRTWGRVPRGKACILYRHCTTYQTEELLQKKRVWDVNEQTRILQFNCGLANTRRKTTLMRLACVNPILAIHGRDTTSTPTQPSTTSCPKRLGPGYDNNCDKSMLYDKQGTPYIKLVIPIPGPYGRRYACKLRVL